MAGTRISRRSMLGTVGAASLAPALTHRAQASPPDSTAPRLRPLFTGNLALGAVSGQPGHRRATITGGILHGEQISGNVQGGRIDWLGQPGGAIEVTARFTVRRADGRLLEISERGLYPSAQAAAAQAVLSTATEVTGAGDSPAPSTALMVGRLDPAQMDAGVVQLAAFEVA